jgi:hypothetical protein
MKRRRGGGREEGKKGATQIPAPSFIGTSFIQHRKYRRKGIIQSSHHGDEMRIVRQVIESKEIEKVKRGREGNKKRRGRLNDKHLEICMLAILQCS